MNKKYLSINLIASIVNLLINLLVNFVLTSFIVKNVGIEANGFINLANTMVGYASIITVALNSVAGRFVAVEYYKNDIKKSNIYFNSALIANFIFAIFFILCSLVIIPNLNKFLNIPVNLLVDVKILFFLILINYSISIISTTFSITMFVSNKLYITNIVTALGTGLRGIICLIFYSLFPSSIVYFGISAATVAIITCIIYFWLFNKEKLELKINFRFASFKYLKMMLTSGIWSSVSSLSNTINDGISLMISNIFINPLVMGQLSLARTLANVLNSILSNITSVFAPNLTYLYAQKDKQEFYIEIKNTMMQIAYFGGVVFLLLFTLGQEVIELWVPNEDTHKIYVLLILIIFSFYNSPVTNTLYNVFLITNKLKYNSLFWLGISIIDTIIIFIILLSTNLGIYAIAGVPTLIGFICNFTFIPIYAAKCLNLKWNYFMPCIIKYFSVTIFLSVFAMFIKNRFVIKTWVAFMKVGFIIGLFLLIGFYILLLNKQQKKSMWDIMKRKYKKE